MFTIGELYKFSAKTIPNTFKVGHVLAHCNNDPPYWKTPEIAHNMSDLVGANHS